MIWILSGECELSTREIEAEWVPGFTLPKPCWAGCWGTAQAGAGGWAAWSCQPPARELRPPANYPRVVTESAMGSTELAWRCFLEGWNGFSGDVNVRHASGPKPGAALEERVPAGARARLCLPARPAGSPLFRPGLGGRTCELWLLL